MDIYKSLPKSVSDRSDHMQRIAEENDIESAMNQLDPPKDMRILGHRKRHSSLPGARSLEEKTAGHSLPATSANVNNLNGYTKPLPYTKNSKKSRNGVKGRGDPKKVGGGGKWTWGAPGSELQAEVALDSDDPNYDSGSDAPVIAFDTAAAELTFEEFERMILSIFKEYLENPSCRDFIELIRDYNIKSHRPSMIPLLIEVAMERHDPEREQTSRLLTGLKHSQILQNPDFVEGFDKVLDQLDDLSLDTPNAAEILGRFIARAIADRCLPNSFVAGFDFQNTNRSDTVRKAMSMARVLLRMNRMEAVWGDGGGTKPVQILSKKIELMLKEYISSGDKEEVIRCIRELDAPHFHHEVVYQAVMTAVENTTVVNGCGVTECIVPLLKYLYESGVVTVDQLEMGFTRVYRQLPDLVLDVPTAYDAVTHIVSLSLQEGFVNKSLAASIPRRMRRRFISECVHDVPIRQHHNSD